jgi:hypothetical protein
MSLLFFALSLFSSVSVAAPTKISNKTLFFNPAKNKIHVEQQKIDFDITHGDLLRLGPLQLNTSSMAFNITREQGEFYEIEFGLDNVRKLGPIYVISFRWPIDFIEKGLLEIKDDAENTLWRTNVTEEGLKNWSFLLEEQTNKIIFEKNRSEIEKSILELKAKGDIEKLQKRMNLARPKQLSVTHQQTQYGLTHNRFEQIPISQIVKPFHFCLTDESRAGRLKVCSRRYMFQRIGGKVQALPVRGAIKASIEINDKTVSDKGSAIFIENSVPIRLVARLSDGASYEFISNPKEINVIDLVQDYKNNLVQAIGYGDPPVGSYNELFYADAVNWSFLNFKPTIGDLRKFWTASTSTYAPYFYLKGVGGAPFRQSFVYDKLPDVESRIQIGEMMPRSTYKSEIVLRAQANPNVEVSSENSSVVRPTTNEIDWTFLLPKKNDTNLNTISIKDHAGTWLADYEMYRGAPGELSARLVGAASSGGSYFLLNEIALQYWFESILGSQNKLLSLQRWGIAAKNSQSMAATDDGIILFDNGTVDIKYRLTPGVWMREPTVGLMASYLNFAYGIEDTLGEVKFYVPVAGGGVFWARSMPKFFDDIFNIIPFLRYPKWVDWEFIYYPLELRDKQKSNFMFSMNFHGKVLWTKTFFGEAGFSLKNFSFEDVRSSNPDKQLGPSVVAAFGTIGIGIHF